MSRDKILYESFRSQRDLSKLRGIDFLLTFEEWLQIWQDSGHLNERGRKKGQYCMARYGDVGPYSVENVKIILHANNVKEGLTGIPKPLEMMENLRLKRIATPASIETKLKISKANKGKTLGRPKAEKTRIKMAVANCKRAKVSYIIAQEIRTRYIPRKMSQKKLAEVYGISEILVWNIVNNKMWTEEI